MTAFQLANEIFAQAQSGVFLIDVAAVFGQHNTRGKMYRHSACIPAKKVVCALEHCQKKISAKVAHKESKSLFFNLTQTHACCNNLVSFICSE
jgi:hypothetical protein